jgi:hypothetical protein
MAKKISKRRKSNKGKEIEPAGFSWYTCKNCSYTFEGLFCPSCGQSIKEVQQPISHFLKDIFGSLFAMDIRIVKSLPALLFNPGKLSAEYIDGKRKSHIAPFRFFLFSSLIFFFLISLQTQNMVDKAFDELNDPLLVDSTQQALSSIRANIGDQDTVLAISSFRNGMGLVDLYKSYLHEAIKDTSLTVEEINIKEKQIQAADNPDVVLSKAYQYISWSFFALMPLFALFLFMFFRKQRKFFVEHLIYSVNLHTFFFILLIFIVVLGMIFPNLLSGMGGWVFLLALAYAMIGIRNFYNKKWLPSFFLTIAIFTLYLLSIFILIILTLIVMVLIA